MKTDPNKERLDALDARIKAAKGEEEKPHHSGEHYSQAQLAWRMVIELVAGLLLGFGIGAGLDWVFGTTPIFMVVFLFFGLAAGVRTMMRSAQEVQAKMAADAAETEEDTHG